MGVILDTTVLVAAERGRFDMPGFLQSLGEVGVSIAAVTAGELLFGFEQATDPGVRARRGAYVEGILEAIPTAPFELAEARRHAALWADLARRGELIGPYDMLVAATALANDSALATLNRGEFERVPGLSLVELGAFLIDRGTGR
jgi:tRNA(fMet)-specific endonuclease VapC